MVEVFSDKAIKIHFSDGSSYVFADDNPTETITAAFNGAMERFKERLGAPAGKGER